MKEGMGCRRRALAAVWLVVLVMTGWWLQALVTNAEEMQPVKAKAALLVEQNSGKILYEQNAHVQLDPASTTKIMTALVVMDAVDSGSISLEDNATVTEESLEGIPSDSSFLKEKLVSGEVMTVREYLYSMMLNSDSTSCQVLAIHTAGSVDAFVVKMNEKAADLGCEDSQFQNTTGYTAENHHMTAWDLYLVAAAALEYPELATIVNTADYTVPATNRKPERKIHNSNWMLGMPKQEEGSILYPSDYTYAYAHGVKTGRTNAAGNCLVSYAEKNGMRTFGVILGAENVKVSENVIQREIFSESSRLFDWGFHNYHYLTAAHPGEVITAVPVNNGVGTNFVMLRPGEVKSLLLPSEVTSEELERTYSLLGEAVEAPVSAGEVLGEMVISLDGETLSVVSLQASDDVAAVPPEPETPAKKLRELSQGAAAVTVGGIPVIFWAGMLLVAGMLVEAIFLVRAYAGNRRRKRRRRRKKRE